jgi:hypothetical protein
LTVTGPAATVEILLDGLPAAGLSGPSWKGTVDFGPALHEMVARALDAEGNETGRDGSGRNPLRTLPLREGIFPSVDKEAVMRIKNATLLLLALTLTLAALTPVQLPAQTGAYCEGDCNGSEVHIGCPWTTSASACCAYANFTCGSGFSGVCSGDAELFCP